MTDLLTYILKPCLHCHRKRRLSPVASVDRLLQRRILFIKHWSASVHSSSILGPNGLSTLATIVAEFGDCRQNRRLSPKTVAEFGDSRRFWRQSPNLATVAGSGFWRQSPF